MLDCEYENRCVNSDKCYRCNNLSLLKLPEDKQKSKHNKTKIKDYRVSSADDSWKDLEQSVADGLNKVPTIKEARRSRMSGALWFEKGDIVDQLMHPECKERTGQELKSGEKSISIHKEWLEKAKSECASNEKTMVLPFRFKNDTNIYAILDMEDILQLVTMTKAYMQDNDIQAKEIELLKRQLKMELLK